MFDTQPQREGRLQDPSTNCWNRQLLEHTAEAFGGGAHTAQPVDLAPLHAKIDQLALQNDFLEGALTKA